MSEHQMPAFVSQLSGFYATWVLAIAERSGLIDVLQEAPGTAAEIAARAGLDERNTLEALRGLVAADFARIDGDTFSLTDDARTVLDPSFPIGVRAVLRVNGYLSPSVGIVVEAMRRGQGIAGTQFAEIFGAGLQAMSGINLPMYRQALCSDWLAGTPAIAAVLDRGADIADIACGSGDTVRMVADAFPASRVQGWDPFVAPSIDLPGNATLHAGSLTDVPSASFDLALCLDSFHHLGDPAVNAAHLHRILRPGGVLLIAEEAATGNLATDAADPTSVIGYGSRLIYCMQENIAAGGQGLTSSDGNAWIDESLRRTGFTDIEARDTDFGMRLITARWQGSMH